MSDSTWRETFGLVLADLSSERIFELHREVSREATKRYRRTRRYRDNYRAGMNAARGLREDVSPTKGTEA